MRHYADMTLRERRSHFVVLFSLDPHIITGLGVCAEVLIGPVAIKIVSV